jgi:hypothetical protein
VSKKCTSGVQAVSGQQIINRVAQQRDCMSKLRCPMLRETVAGVFSDGWEAERGVDHGCWQGCQSKMGGWQKCLSEVGGWQGCW